MTYQTKLDQDLKAVCPVHGISIGRKNDKATWRIDFKDGATAQERAAAQAVVDAFDVAAAEAPDPRLVLDEAEAAASKIDPQIQSDLNMTPAEVATLVDTLFSGWTAPQRVFMKRLVRMVIAAARRALR